MGTRGAGARRQPSPLGFGLCAGTIGAASAALAVFATDFLMTASQPPGELQPGLGVNALSTLLSFALFVCGPLGMIGGLALAAHRPAFAERIESAVYVLTPLALLLNLGAAFGSYVASV